MKWGQLGEYIFTKHNLGTNSEEMMQALQEPGPHLDLSNGARWTHYEGATVYFPCRNPQRSPWRDHGSNSPSPVVGWG